MAYKNASLLTPHGMSPTELPHFPKIIIYHHKRDFINIGHPAISVSPPPDPVTKQS
jgi:hypothetical protein